MNMNIEFRTVKKKDLKIIKKLFIKTYGIRISSEFYNWRYYYKQKYSSFVGILEGEIISHVGFCLYNSGFVKLLKKEYIASRHSSFVLKKFRRYGIYTNIVKSAIRYLSKNYFISGSIIWPNGINILTHTKNYPKNIYNEYNIFKREINLHEKIDNRNLINSKIIRSEKLKKKKLHNLLNSNKIHSLIKKDIQYFNWRYLSYKRKNYIYYLNENDKIYQSLIIMNLVIKNQNIKLNILDYFSIYKDSINSDISFLLSSIQNYFSNYRYKKLDIYYWSNIKDDHTIKLLKNLKFQQNKSKKYYIDFIGVDNKTSVSYSNKFANIFKMGDTDVFFDYN